MPMKASCEINYCVVDTIKDNGHLQFFWDIKSLLSRLEIIGPEKARI